MNIIDARTFQPHAVGHAAILGALSAVSGDITLTVVAPMIPTPLYDEVEARFPNQFTYEVASEENGEFHIRFKKK